MSNRNLLRKTHEAHTINQFFRDLDGIGVVMQIDSQICQGLLLNCFCRCPREMNDGVRKELYLRIRSDMEGISSEEELRALSR